MAVIKNPKDRDDDFGVWMAQRKKNDPRAKKALEERDAWLVKMGALKPEDVKKTAAKKPAAKKAAPKKTTTKKK